jgi:hypothetical protein
MVFFETECIRCDYELKLKKILKIYAQQSNIIGFKPRRSRDTYKSTLFLCLWDLEEDKLYIYC